MKKLSSNSPHGSQATKSKWLLCSVFLSTVHLVLAADGTWNKGYVADPLRWSDSSNWLSGAIAEGIGSSAMFTGINLTTGTSVIELDYSPIIGAIYLGDSNTDDRKAHTFRAIDDNGIILNNGTSNALIVQHTFSEISRFETPLFLESSLDIFNINTAFGMVFSGGISSNTAGNKVITLKGMASTVYGTNPLVYQTTSGQVTMDGVISNGEGVVSLNIDSPSGSTLILNQANTFTGGVTLNEGILELNHNGAIGSGTFTINGGMLASKSTSRITLVGTPVILNGDFSFLGTQTLDISSSTNTVTMTKDIVFSAIRGQFSMYGVVGDGGNGYSMTKTGAGTLYYSQQTNTYTGGTYLEGGRIIINGINSVGTGKIYLKNGSGVAFNGVGVTQALVDKIDTAANGYLGTWSDRTVTNNLNLSQHSNLYFGSMQGILTYTGTLTPYGDTYKLGGYSGTTTNFNTVLSGENRSVTLGVAGTATGTVVYNASNTYGGDTSVNGTMILQVNGLNGGIASSSNLNLNGNSTFRYDNTGATDAIGDTFGNLNALSGETVVTHTRTVDQNTKITFAGYSRSQGATINFTATGTNASAAGNQTSFTAAPASSSFINQGLFYQSTNYAAYDAGGFVRAFNYATDIDASQIAAGSNLNASVNKHVNLGGAVTNQGTVSIKTLRIGGAYDLSLSSSSTLTLTEGGILKAGATASKISGGTGITAGAQEFLIRVADSSDTLTIESNILSSSTGGLTKSGAGTLILSGNNQYSGVTTVNAGTLRLLGIQAASSGNFVLSGGTLDLRANNATPGYDNGAFKTLSFGNNVTVIGDSTINVNNISNGISVRDKTIQLGDLNIGGNTLTVSNGYGYGLEFSGITTLSGGVFGNTNFTVGTARASNLLPGLHLSGKVTGTSQITLKGAGTFHLSNTANDFIGDIWVTAGVLSASSDEALGHQNNAIKLMDTESSSAFRATETFATSRTIRLGNNITNRNILQVTAGKTFSLLSAFDGQNGFVKSDNGTLALYADNSSWAGNVIVHDGVVDVHHAGALGTAAGTTQVANFGAAVHLSAGATFDEDFYLFNSGVNATGALLSKAGHNTLTGDIWITGDATLGVAQGSILEITDEAKFGIDYSAIHTTALNDQFELTFTGAGTGIFNTSIDLKNSQLHINGKGSWQFNDFISSTRDINVINGTMILGGENGSVNSINAAWKISAGATLILDNTDYALNNRLGLRGVYFGGEIVIKGAQNAVTIETISGANFVTGNSHGILTLDAQGTGQVNFVIPTGGSFSRNARGTALFRGDNLGLGFTENGTSMFAQSIGPSHIGQNGAIGTTQKGVLPWALLDTKVDGLGEGFATYDSTYGMRLLRENEQLKYAASTSNIRLGEDKGALANYQVNSLHLENGSKFAVHPNLTLEIQSGGILATAGDHSIKGGLIQTTSNREMILHTLGDLEINATLANFTGGLTKTGNGELTISKKNYYTGATTVNQGTLKLAGGDHTLSINNEVYVSYGATLDLNGNHQSISNLRSFGSSGGEIPVNGGLVTNTGSKATLAMNFNPTTLSTLYYAGKVSGNLDVVRSNGNIFVISDEWSHTGTTLINGGITNLRNGGKITQSSKIQIQYGWLQLSNQIVSGDNDRIGDDIDIELNNGMLSLYGQPGEMLTEKVGYVHLASGLNVITSSTSTNNVNAGPQESILYIKSLTRDAAAGATVNFGQAYSHTSAEALGLTSTTSFATEKIIVDGGLNVTNNIVGPWAIVTAYYNYSPIEFAAYDEKNGIGALNSQGFAGYSSSTLPASNQPNQNIRLTADATIGASGLYINSLNSVGAVAKVARVISFESSTALLNLTAGALAFSQSSSATTYTHTLGSSVNNGRITAGGTTPTGPVDLFIYYLSNNASNRLTINSAIVDNPNNGGKALRLILNNANFGLYPIRLASTQNAYTGGTLINHAAVEFSGNLGTGGIIINGGSLTQLSGGTFASQDLTMNGTANVTFAGTNAVKNITIHNNGGSNFSNLFTTTSSVTPTLKLGNEGVLKMEGTLTAESSNIASTALITEGTLDLNGVTRTFAISPIQSGSAILSPDQATLNIASVITGASGEGIVKTGKGLLQLSAANTFTGGIDVQEGGLVISNNTALGSGFLKLGQDTVITADGTARTVSNQVSIQGDFTMGVRGPIIPAALNLSGAITWGNNTHTVTVNSNPSIIQTISGAISGSGGIVKEGIGTLALTGNNSSALDWKGSRAIEIKEGSLRINSGTALGQAPVSTVSDNIVISGGVLSTTGSFVLDSRRGILLGSETSSGSGTVEVVNSADTLTYDGVISNSGTGADTLHKTGAGTLSIGGSNTYSGDTIISAGTLTLSATGSIDQSRRISVQAGSTFRVHAVTGGYQLKASQILEGGGNVIGDTTILSGATLAPGTSVNRQTETLTFTGNLTLKDGSVTLLQISTPTFQSTNHFNGYAYGSTEYLNYVIANGIGQKEHDRIQISGSLTQETGAKIVVLPDDYTPELGQIFNLIDWTVAFNGSSNLGMENPYRDGSNDSMYDLDLPDISFSGLDWDMSLFASHGILVVIPEPSKAILLLLGLTSFALRRRR